MLLDRLSHSSCHQDLKEPLEAPPVLGTSLSLGTSQGTALATAAQAAALPPTIHKASQRRVCNRLLLCLTKGQGTPNFLANGLQKFSLLFKNILFSLHLESQYSEENEKALPQYLFKEITTNSV